MALTSREALWDRRRAVSGHSAMADAVRAYEPILVATARRLCGNTADADDLLHDTYERALRGWERYTDRGNLKSWLMAIMHNVFIDRCRKSKRDLGTDTIEHHEVASPEASQPPAWAAVTAEQVARALDEIGAEFRAVYDLHVAGKSYDEIATKLSIPKATVGTRLLRARKKLKQALLGEIGVTP
ncbi:MAG TPA: RNA polymerase sigma factor [Kofleriaceae bacterium]|jgi:RNA polymerase sigma-70 factor (ECF subfamily)